jgi:hypothetical protein
MSYEGKSPIIPEFTSLMIPMVFILLLIAIIRKRSVISNSRRRWYRD